MEYDRENVSFNVLRNALYHTARRLTFDRWNRWASALVILLGAAAVADFFIRFGIETVYLSIAVTVVGTLQLVFDFGGRARDHQALQRDYYNLLAEMEEAPGTGDLAAFRAKMTRISGDEPPMMKALDAKAYNDAIDALELNEDQRLVIPLGHRLMANLVSFNGSRYPKVCELEAINSDALKGG
ncbi:hypothetical protein [uncultured Martelella sp.]|uniref:hypothetical protein n=1 Tax=uncultured Martelella sp. TaxID=392331 RepID=UPI0029C614DB|nr:hypothetical protein [uncultured Martelella sp.]